MKDNPRSWLDQVLFEATLKGFQTERRAEAVRRSGRHLHLVPPLKEDDDAE